VSEGRDDIAWRLMELYGVGPRLRPAGLPLQYDRYVAEPVAFYDPNGPGTNIGMFVFEMGADSKIAYQRVLRAREARAQGCQRRHTHVRVAADEPAQSAFA